MSKKIIISGGGTGGHIFPAVAIANALKKNIADCEILFVGAEGRMEMQKVPEAGYAIKGLPIVGLQRSLDFKNLLLPIKILKSVTMAMKIIAEFKPDVAIGVGGYASAPLLFAAKLKGIPFIIQEQNSYAGITNKILGKWAKKICVAYDGMQNFFPKEKIVFTGNPVRAAISGSKVTKQEALKFFDLAENKKTVLVIGGSLGARTINQSIDAGIEKINAENMQLIWQTGKGYFETAKQKANSSIKVFDFIKQMDMAYAAADIIISRAGALSVSELCIVAKPCVLVPSPNVAEDHQTKNALSLVNKNAALMIKDAEAKDKLVDAVLQLLKDEILQKNLSAALKNLAIVDADERIVREIFNLKYF
ncbi:MAG: undecaprenyldiphospho-muramoylpentapeptide beta-N-acetylglucosaminyltransferase [Bacteroidota bacterium]|jgi:UDP-N-acetylglucosamine--N-acetylmuramyl-(pentapeptide) pyrophosphoryl-undecaprenol N-acetylglucosamine transferase